MLSAGAKFGKYTVVRTLGAGGVGTVYLVRHDVLDAYFALKVMSADVAARNAQFISRFLREAKLCCRIRHPNLVAVHDAGRDDATGLHYLVMDYAPGGNLREMLEAAAGPLDERRALKIVREVASALVTASEFGLVHRDIKPENIMFGQNGEAKLADLGIAKASDDSSLVTMENAVFGTPAYMSPEQAYDSGKVDARADIYSLGVVLFEMLSGSRPYGGSSSMNIIAKVLAKDPVPDVRSVQPDVPVKYAELVRDMCEKNVARRIQSAKELLGRLDEIDGGAGSFTHAHSNVRHGVDPMIVMSVAGGVIAAAILGAFALFFFKSKSTSSDVPVERASSPSLDSTNVPIELASSPSPEPTNAPEELASSPSPEPTNAPGELASSPSLESTNVPVERVSSPSQESEPPPQAKPIAVPKAESRYIPPKPATVMLPEPIAHAPRAQDAAPVSDPIVPGSAVVIGGEADDAAALRSRFGAAFVTAENSSRLRRQIAEICEKKPSCVYLKLADSAARARMAEDVFDTGIREIADALHDRGVDFEFLLERESPGMAPYNEKMRNLCNQRSYKWRDAGGDQK